MELLIAILIYIGVLNANEPINVEHVHMLEVQHKQQIEDIKASGWAEPYKMNDKTVWDHEEL